ncbi:hypothetical protein CROQUDRAFT_85672 [Cronartium quercuum f. sp. fusiforme G11]|uniref:Uncharacterized protein n=1 Tax=Cronartium quercuum f. sp. fusiforme G11 TaxID=708437 RepID=A0A9P6P045_9BASI|nr:hypothetical protein CROQUDRAFT_85672 [Cronartium quercuum f. sp. fusiforme G11]
MDIDFNSLSTASAQKFPDEFYRQTCFSSKISSRCLHPYNDTHNSRSGRFQCPNAAASLRAKIDFLKNKHSHPSHVPHPPADPPAPALAQPLPFPLPTTPTSQHVTELPTTPSTQPLATRASISAAFSEYASLPNPIYYDLPGAGDSDATTACSHCGWYNSGSNYGDKHGFPLLPRPIPLARSGFDGTPGIGGLITKKWEGWMIMQGDRQTTLDEPISLNGTILGRYNLILGMSWLNKHHAWVGGLGRALISCWDYQGYWDWVMLP